MVASATPDAQAAVSAARAAILDLLAVRDTEKTICPSEAARVVGGEAWRDSMPTVHAAARKLAEEGVIELRQKGARREVDSIVGAYRIGSRRPG